MPNHEYDDDIFTLQEDEAGKRRSHTVQYTVISIFAVLVIAGAYVLGWWLTNERVAYQSNITVDNPTEQGGTTEYINAWPSEQFPSIPVLDAIEYKTNVSEYHAEINVPQMAATNGYEAYTDKLADDGAQVYVRTPRLTVMNYRGTEIHLLSGTGKIAVELCNEPKIVWNEPEYAQFLLPTTGQLVHQEPGTGVGSRWLTYRQWSANDSIQYVSNLVAQGWEIVGTLEPQDHVFACVFKKDNLQITVDYFSGSSNARIKLDFIQQEQNP